MVGIALLNSDCHRQWTIQDDVFRIGPDAKFLGNDDADGLFRGISCEVQSFDQKVRITNFGKSLVLHSGPRLHRGCSIELPLPIHLCSGSTQIHFFDPQQEHPLDDALTILQTTSNNDATSLPAFGVAPSAETLASWFDSLGQLQRSVAGSQDFFCEAAAALFNPGGLDGGIILLPHEGGWKIQASFMPYPEFGIALRSDLVEQSASTKQTVFHDASRIDQRDAVDDIHACIVCPVRDSQNEIAAIVYGFRSQHRTNQRRGIRTLEAQFVQVVADSMAAALCRLESEAAAARTRVLLEQAFSPKIARALESNPRILDGTTREVSVMFADLRDFSTISERIGPKRTYRLLTDVMDHFSSILTDYDGVIIDYFGDGVSAFWNAPIDQENHPLLACEAGMGILQSLPELNEIWSSRIGQLLRVGIGIHTGMAEVGNAGSSRRLKYGPQGNTVNLASRIENATKAIGVNFLVSGEAAELVSDYYLKRRVFTTRLKGIKTPIELIQVFDKKLFAPEVSSFREYEQALSYFEAGQFRESIDQLTLMQLGNKTDSVVELLLQNAVARHSAGGGTQRQRKSDISPLTLEDIQRTQESDLNNSKVKTPVE